MKKHSEYIEECECDFCKNFEATKKKEAEMMKQCGWIVHYVFDDTSCPFNTNAHTHGLETKYKHLNIQICMPMKQEAAHGIFWNIVRRIEAGDKFIPGKRYDKIIVNYDVMFTYSFNDNKDEVLLRLIFPDANGRFDTAPFNKQLEGTFNNLN